MSGFVDFFRMVMGWWSGADSGEVPVTVTPTLTIHGRESSTPTILGCETATPTVRGRESATPTLHGRD